jgi:SAM-dependent methyltransferase
LPVPADARVLDAGCGSGRTLEELGRYGKVFGVELDPGAAAVARERRCGEVLVGRLEVLPWEDGFFDLITCLDVIEHTPDDRVTLRELRRVCRRGGFLVVTVPAYQGLWSMHDVANHHYRRYSRGRLRAAAAAAGWRVRRMTSFNGLLLGPAAAVRLAERRRLRQPDSDYKPELTLGPEWLNAALEQPLRLEARWLARGRTMPAGLSLLAVLENG